MPDTPIDQSAGIQSIRLKVPTGTVPIPPVGFGQLHSPSPGTLALRLPDGSVAEIGGGGAGTPGVLSGTGGVVEALSNPFTGAGVAISPAAGQTIFLNGPVVGPEPDQPFGGRVAPVVVSSGELAALHLTPKVLVSGIPGRVIWPRLIYFHMVGVTTAYLHDPGALLFLTLGEGNLFHDQNVDAGSLVDGIDTVASLPTANIVLGSVQQAAWVGQPLQLWSTVPLVGGDGALHVTTDYLAV